MLVLSQSYIVIELLNHPSAITISLIREWPTLWLHRNVFIIVHLCVFYNCVFCGLLMLQLYSTIYSTL